MGGSILSHDHFQGGHYEFADGKSGRLWRKTFSGGWLPGGWQRGNGALAAVCDPAAASENREQAGGPGGADPGARGEATRTEAGHGPGGDGRGAPQYHHPHCPDACRAAGSWIWCCATISRRRSTLWALYHPHQELHHIKKENIGLIEVMGLAVLPARLQGRAGRLSAKRWWMAGTFAADEVLAKHADWAEELTASVRQLPTAIMVEQILRKETGNVFCRVLEDAGVYKCNEEGREAFRRFVRTLSL